MLFKHGIYTESNRTPGTPETNHAALSNLDYQHSGHTGFEASANKVNEIIDTPVVNTYPTAAAVKNYVDSHSGGGSGEFVIRIAEASDPVEVLGWTDYQIVPDKSVEEIVTALENEQVVVFSDQMSEGSAFNVIPLVYANFERDEESGESSYNLMFFAAFTSMLDAWTFVLVQAQGSSSLNAESDEIDASIFIKRNVLMENQSNKVTSITNSADNAHYPSVKAVKDYVDAAIAAALGQ